MLKTASVLNLRLKSTSLLRSIHRSLSLTRGRASHHLPALMPLPNIVGPKPSFTLRNWMLARTLITPFFDPDFSISDFDLGAHHAAVSVANSLALGDVSSLDHVVTPEAVRDIGKNLR